MVAAQLSGIEDGGRVIRTGWPIWFGFQKNKSIRALTVGAVPAQINVGTGASAQAAEAVQQTTGCCGSRFW